MTRVLVSNHEHDARNFGARQDCARRTRKNEEEGGRYVSYPQRRRLTIVLIVRVGNATATLLLMLPLVLPLPSHVTPGATHRTHIMHTPS